MSERVYIQKKANDVRALRTAFGVTSSAESKETSGAEDNHDMGSGT